MKPATQDKTLPADTGDPPIVLRLRPVLELSGDQLLGLSSLNRDLRLELTAKGELVVMPPTGFETGSQNLELTMQVGIWAKSNGSGVAADSSTGFVLPNGAIRALDASWVTTSRLETLRSEQRKRYLPLCLDFVVELRSPNDRLNVVQDKMREYMENGARLGWLIDPQQKRVYIYSPGEPVRELDNPRTISGDPVLPGFVLDLQEVW